LVLLMVFTYYPAGVLIYNSFTKWKGVGPKQWIGWANYRQFFRDPSFLGVFSHHLSYLIVGFLQIGLAMFFAVLLNSPKLKGRNFFKTVMFMPYIINSIAIAFVLKFVFDNQYGAINQLLRQLGLKSWTVNWLGDPAIVNYTLAFMSLWKYLGLGMVIILAGLQSVNSEIYEAASLDGAGPFQTFRYVTLPCIKNVLQLMLFMNLSGALNAFEFSFAMFPSNEGATSPLKMADTFMTKTINTAFFYNNFGLASAMGVMLMIITAILVLVQNRLFAGKGD